MNSIRMKTNIETYKSSVQKIHTHKWMLKASSMYIAKNYLLHILFDSHKDIDDLTVNVTVK